LTRDSDYDPHDRLEPVIRRLEFVAIAALEVFLMLTIGIAIVILFVLLWHALRTNSFDSLETVQHAMQKSFSGVLLVMLGLELLETLRTYFKTHHVKVEVILIVAIIAAGSHVIEIDVAHAPGVQLLSYGGLMLALTASYFLIKRTHASSP
jgi:uncharacterized membrane protein (DUF373 family)